MGDGRVIEAGQEAGLVGEHPARVVVLGPVSADRLTAISFSKPCAPVRCARRTSPIPPTPSRASGTMRPSVEISLGGEPMAGDSHVLAARSPLGAKERFRSKLR